MAGLSLGMSTGFVTPHAALPPSYAGSPAGQTISARAYGINGDAVTHGGPATAAYGSTAIGIAGACFLVWLWYTLPR